MLAPRRSYDASIRRSGIHVDTLANFLNIAESVYGLNLRGEDGQFAEEPGLELARAREIFRAMFARR